MILGKTSEELAADIVGRVPGTRLGSRTKDGMRRVVADCSGKQLAFAKDQFDKIAITIAGNDGISINEASKPLPCVHRGSQRKTCCGSPDLWICRELKTDCVASSSDAAKLRQMVDTVEAASISVCHTCPHRKTVLVDASPHDSWPTIGTMSDTYPKVGFISVAYLPIGGTETFHRSLLPRLKNIINVVGFVATAFHGGDGAKLQVPYATGIEAARQLAAHCDVIVVWGIHDFVKILPANRPKVIAVHHSDWSGEWNNNLILSQIDLIDEVICVNEHTATELASRGKPVRYIPNAIDPERVTPSGKQSELRSQFQIPPDSKIVLFGHRLSTEKRPLLAVEIARKLPDGWVMVIAGDGPKRTVVEDAARDCDRARIVGACDSLADWLSVSDCFLSLSTFEGFGLAIGEAMASGVPTVSTSTGIATGLATTLTNDATPAEWANAIVTAKRTIEPEVIIERFSVQRMMDSWVGVIKGLQ